MLESYRHIIDETLREDGFNPAPMFRTFLVLTLLAAALVLTFALGQRQTAALLPAGPEARTEYYRGLYDTCVAVSGPEIATSRALCLGIAGRAADKHWYESESVGWAWPVEK